MKCSKCGGEIYPGDQICMHCGAKLSIDNVVSSVVEEVINETKPKKANKWFVLLIILGVLILIIIIVLVIKFLVLR